jgi:hypothetical protein
MSCGHIFFGFEDEDVILAAVFVWAYYLFNIFVCVLTLQNRKHQPTILSPQLPSSIAIHLTDVDIYFGIKTCSVRSLFPEY